MTDTTTVSTGKVLPLTNGAYDLLRKITNYVLPSFATFYFTVAPLLGLPYAEQVIGGVTALVIFINVCLGVSKSSYNKSDAPYDGYVGVDSGALVGLNIDLTAEEIKNKGVVVIKVKDVTEPEVSQ